jgi:uncharacterized protein GlcG (DUF336 family)
MLRYEQATRLIAEAIASGRALGLRPLAVAVLDPGGHLLSFGREDQAGILRPEIAIGKAWGALGMGLGSRALAAAAETRPAFIAALGPVSGGRMVPVAGGVLIRDDDGAVLGAIGISGDTSDQDEACALRAVETLGLRADPG